MAHSSFLWSCWGFAHETVKESIVYMNQKATHSKNRNKNKNVHCIWKNLFSLYWTACEFYDNVGVCAGVTVDGAQEAGGRKPDIHVHDQLRVCAAGDQEKCFCLHSGSTPHWNLLVIFWTLVKWMLNLMGRDGVNFNWSKIQGEGVNFNCWWTHHVCNVLCFIQVWHVILQ